MTHFTPEPVISGWPYAVTEVAGRPPQTFDEFVHHGRFVIDRDGTPYEVVGTGVLVEDGVRFHEKDMGHDGKDVRVWQVTRIEDGTFMVQHAAAF
jgi:hypothetical protein